MITDEQIDILLSEPVRRAVEKNMERDPLETALDKNVPYPSLVASQVKYLRRARTKLPSYYRARCIIPGRAFEQSSSELVAGGREYSGALCIDLTCGLGVDAFCLSHRFERVIAIERDPLLAKIARINFGLLGAENITVVNAPAEQFLAETPDITADLVFADPDRRDASGRKMVALGDCSPDIGTLLPVIGALSPRIAVKLSPLFDVGEAFAIFGSHVRVNVISADNECKEVVAEIDACIARPLVRATVAGRGYVERPYKKGVPQGCAASASPGDFRLLIIPDVALAKAGLAVEYFSPLGAHIESDNSFAFADRIDAGVYGRTYMIEHAEPYSPRKLKTELKSRGVKRLNILKRDCPLSTADIVKQLGVGEGGDRFAAFTRMGGALWAIFLKGSPVRK